MPAAEFDGEAGNILAMVMGMEAAKAVAAPVGVFPMNERMSRVVSIAEDEGGVATEGDAVTEAGVVGVVVEVSLVRGAIARIRGLGLGN